MNCGTDSPGGEFTCEPEYAAADISSSNLLTRALILTGIQEALMENLIYQRNTELFCPI